MAAPRQKDRRKGRDRRAPQPPPPPDPYGGGGGGGGGGSGGSTGGGGSSSGGSTSGSSGSTGGGSSAPARPKETKKEKKAKLQAYINALAGIGLPPGPYKKIIKAAAKKGMGTSTFLRRISRTKAFKKKYPGIKEFMGETTSVSSAVNMWKAQVDAYRDAAQSLGIEVNLNKQRLKQLILGDVSPEEFAQRLVTMQKMRESQDSMNAFNAALQAFGLPQLDEGGIFKFLMGTADAELYDIYETVQLTQMGLDSQEARDIARAVGVMGQPADLSSLPGAIAALKSEAGQEFAQTGIGVREMALAALAASGEPIEGSAREEALRLQQAIEQQLRNRQARVGARSGVQPQQSQSGRPVLPGAPAYGGLESVG